MVFNEIFALCRWCSGSDETDIAMDYPDRNRCGGREAIHQEARKPISQEPSVIHTNGVSVLSFAAHHG
jgi:hypothetical protein